MSEQQEIIYRHSLPIRVTHWVNALVLLVLIMSGLQIFNAHPALNWGKSSYNGKPPVLLLSDARRASKSLAEPGARTTNSLKRGPVKGTENPSSPPIRFAAYAAF